MKYAEWIVWVVLAYFALMYPFSIRSDLRHGKIIHPATLLQSLLAWVALVLFVIYPWNKLHILWVMPAIFLVSFITTSRIPILSRIALFFSYFYAGVVCLGCPLPPDGTYVYDPDKMREQ